ncbi:glycosyltransferase [Patescibacteria group bacterium]|nr:glycosyltransferase [Patescibacteria group bacterium]
MSSKPLLSIAIPTYNRAVYLKNLLDYIIPQIKDGIEICVSNNGSSDNTREVVMNFKEKYPDLIKYNENKEDLGDRNLFQVMEMSEGDYIWLFADDDSIIPNGLEEVINFIKKNCKENTALVTLKSEAYFIDKKTGKKTVYYTSLEPDKPLVFEINRENIIEANFPDSVFLSILIFKNSFFKKILEQERELAEKSIGSHYPQVFLYRLMFLKFSDVKGLALNKHIVSQELPYYKISIEDRFKKHYVCKKRLNKLLLSSGYVNDATIKRIKEMDRGFRWNIVQHLILMKAFKTFFYSSYLGVLKGFFQKATLRDGLMFSLTFIIASLTPSFILRSILKIYFFLKHGKKWRSHWTFYNTIHYKVSQVPTLYN